MGIAWEVDSLNEGVCPELALLYLSVYRACYDNGLDPYPLVIEEFDADEIVEIALMVVFLLGIHILISDNNSSNFIISIILVWVRFMRWL